MNHVTILVAWMLLAGCPGGSSPLPIVDNGVGGELGFGDGRIDSAPVPDSSLPDAPSTDAAGCPFGNLLAAIPALPPLCRPFAPPAPGPPPQDPPECQTAPQVDLTAGPDTYTGSDTVKDVVMGLDGADIIKGLGCADILNGNAGADELHGNEGADELHAGAGDDKVFAGAGSDSIWGGGGADTIAAGGGDDKLYYAEGDGNDEVTEFSGYDTIICAPNFGAPKARITGWSRVGDDLVLTMTAGGSVKVIGYFVSADSSIDEVVGCD